MHTDTRPADYMLFADGKACSIIEAKREGYNLGDVVQQSRRYAISHTKHIERWANHLPFTYEATNYEIRFCDWSNRLSIKLDFLLLRAEKNKQSILSFSFLGKLM